MIIKVIMIKELEKIERRIKKERAYYKNKKYEYQVKSNKLKRLNKQIVLLMEENKLLAEQRISLEKQIDSQLTETDILKKYVKENCKTDYKVNVIIHLIMSTFIIYICLGYFSQTRNVIYTDGVACLIVFIQVIYISTYLSLFN